MSDSNSVKYFNQLLTESFESQSVVRSKRVYNKICKSALSLSRRELEKQILKSFSWEDTKKIMSHVHIHFRKTYLIKFLSEKIVIEKPICPYIRKIKYHLKVDYYNTMFSTNELNKNFKKFGKDYLPVRKAEIIDMVKKTGDIIDDPLLRAYGCYIHYKQKFNEYIIPFKEFEEYLSLSEEYHFRERKIMERCKAIYKGLHKKCKDQDSETVFLYDPLPFLYEFKRFAREGFNLRPPDYESSGEGSVDLESEYDSSDSVVNTDTLELFSRFYGSENFPDWNRNELDQYSSSEEDDDPPLYLSDDEVEVTNFDDLD